MKSYVGARWMLAVTLILVCSAAAAEAQQGRSPLEFLESSKESAQAGWEYLMIAAAFVIGGGSASTRRSSLTRRESARASTNSRR